MCCVRAFCRTCHYFSVCCFIIMCFRLSSFFSIIIFICDVLLALLSKYESSSNLASGYWKMTCDIRWWCEVISDKYTLSHYGACIFPVRALKRPYVYYTPLYHKKRNNMLHLTDLFVPVSLTHEFFEPLQAVRYLGKTRYLQAYVMAVYVCLELVSYRIWRDLSHHVTKHLWFLLARSWTLTSCSLYDTIPHAFSLGFADTRCSLFV